MVKMKKIGSRKDLENVEKKEKKWVRNGKN